MVKPTFPLPFNLQSQRVNAPDQLGAKSLVYRAMTGDPVHAVEGARADMHLKVALPTLLIPCVTAMFLALIDNFQKGRRESRLEFLANFVFDAHFSHLPPSIFAPTR